MSEQNGTTLTPEIMQTIATTVARSMYGGMFGTSHQGLRDYYSVLGYPLQPTYEQYYDWATRDSLGRRLIRNLPQHTWQYPPIIRDTEEVDAPETPFMQAWEALVTRFQLWRLFERVDKQALIGNYAILFLGLRGARDPSQEVDARTRTMEDLLYLRPYSQRHVRIQAYESDVQNPRYGLPRLYRLQKGDAPQRVGDESSADIPIITTDIHASRVIHVAEDVIEDDIFATPRLAGTYQRLIDILKIAGGSAEMFWRHAKREIAISAQDGFRFEGDDKQRFEQQVQEFTHQLRDYLFLHGMDVQALAPGVQSPLEHFQVQASLIAADWQVPQRLLFGSERGELASTQDIRNYVSVISGRQVHFAQPSVIESFILRMVQYGILPEPAMPLVYDWPDLYSLGEEEQAKIAADWSTAIQRYDQADTMSGGSVVGREEFRAAVLHGLQLPPEEPDVEDEPELNDEDI